MKKASSLIALVGSLSRGEKKHIMTNSLIKGTVPYELFKFITEKKPANDEEIKKAFAKKKFIRQFHVAKIALADIIYESMSRYYMRDTADHAIYKELDKVDFLFGKELFSAALSSLEKAHKKALLYEKPHIIPEILKWKKKVYAATGGIVPSGTIMNALHSESGACLAELEAENYFWKEAVGSQFFFNSDRQQVKTKVEEVTLAADLRGGISLPSRILKNHLFFTLHTMLDNFAEAGEYCAAIINEMEARPHIMRDDPKPYFTACYNLIGMHIGRRDYASVSLLLDKIHAAPGKFSIDESKKVTLNSRARAYNIEIEIYRDLKKYRQAYLLMETVKQFLDSDGARVSGSYKYNMYFQFAHISFELEKYDETFSWLNELFRIDSKQVRSDILRFAKLLSLLTHYESENFSHLVYAVDNYKKFLKKNAGMYGFERILLSGILKLAGADKHDKDGIFAAIAAGLENSKREQAIYTGYFDLAAWVERKRGGQLA